MILTAYLDESGTHEGSPATIVAGVLGSAKQWKVFDVLYRSIKKKFGFTVFHAKDLKAHRGEFKGWSQEKTMSLIQDMANITKTSDLITCLAFRLDNEQYEKEYLAGETPKKLRLDSRYGLAFRGCITHLLQEVDKRRPNSRKQVHQMHVVVEAGHKNAGDAVRVFDELVKEVKAMGDDLLGTLTFAGKERDPLAAADFFAYLMLTVERREKITGQEDPLPREDDEGIFAARGFRPGELAQFKASLIERHLASRQKRPSTL